MSKDHHSTNRYRQIARRVHRPRPGHAIRPDRAAAIRSAPPPKSPRGPERASPPPQFTAASSTSMMIFSFAGILSEYPGRP
jgi:hypothetical protein